VVEKSLAFSENGRFVMSMIHLRELVAPLALAAVLFGCTGSNKLQIRRTRDSQDLAGYNVKSLTGVRDGDKLKSQLVLAGKDGTLTLLLNFQIGVPTKLESGTWLWSRTDVSETLQGTVQAVGAVTFQGGQDGPPSLGGNFALVGKDVDVSLYEVKLPVTRVETAGKTPFNMP
jgi:hypothetical protein